MILFDEWQQHDKSISQFQSGIRSQIRGLWNGNLSVFNFVDGMQSVITRGFTQAWNEGAATCGIQPDELSADEIRTRDRMIIDQLPFLPAFATDIEEKSRANGGRLQPLFDRGFMWVNRYNEAKAQAQSMACADMKGIWVVGPTEHCKSCLGFNGRVYRMSVWRNNGALPQTRVLCCRGYKCRCRIDQTDSRITPGRFPRGLLCG